MDENNEPLAEKPKFSAIYSSTAHALTVQHSEKVDGERQEFEFKFHHGVLRFDDEVEHDRFLRALKTAHPSLSSLIRRQDLAAAEQIARAHADQMRRENRAIAGPFTAALAAQAGSEAREAQYKGQADTAGGKVTAGTLRSLFQMGKPAVGGEDNK